MVYRILNTESPLTAEDLAFAGASENPGKNQTVIVAISHDHFDHLNYRTLKKLPENTHYYVPHGIENEFPSRYANIVGRGWNTQDTIGELTIHSYEHMLEPVSRL